MFFTQNIKYLIPIIIISTFILVFAIISEIRGPFFLKGISTLALILLIGTYCCINSILFDCKIDNKIKILYLVLVQICSLLIILAGSLIGQF